MQPTGTRSRRFGSFTVGTIATISGIVLGVIGGRTAAAVPFPWTALPDSWAAMLIPVAAEAIPAEHRGLSVSSAGAISSASMNAQIGLDGYKLQLREITIEPGGQIARHGHQTRPGVVKVISGTWTEGRPDGENDYSASEEIGILEDELTEHWFWNRGSEPATAMVCDIVQDN
jgi:quercetin dioxygenase-like cupin family protein